MDYKNYFDNIINRKSTQSMKWDFQKEHLGYSTEYPMWVADTDFRVCEKINDELCNIAKREIYGYTERDEEYFYSIINWFDKRYNWRISKDWIETTFGVIYTIGELLEIVSSEGDEVIIQSPVYNNFKSIIEMKKRVVVDNPLKENSYEMDFTDLRRKITSKTKALILCNPHNPLGKVWKEEELKKLVEICRKNEIFIISDEIHGDLSFDKYIPLGKITDYQNIAVCTSPGKGFNLISLKLANIIIPNLKIKESLFKRLKVNGFDNYNIFSLKACEVAYNFCEEWLEQQNNYIRENHRYLDKFLKNNIPKMKLYRSEASFLAWIDCRELRMSTSELKKFLVEKVGVSISMGEKYGKNGEGFIRLNLGCSRQFLKEVLEKIKGELEKND